MRLSRRGAILRGIVGVTEQALKIHTRRTESAWRVPILDHESFGNSLQKRRATKDRAMGAIDELFDASSSITPNFGPDLKDYLNCSDVLKEYAPFLGNKGFMGLGTTRVEAGDLQCLLYSDPRVV